MFSLYLAAKVAYAKGDATITAEHIEDVADLTIGHEDAERVAELVAEASGMKRVVCYGCVESQTRQQHREATTGAPPDQTPARLVGR